MATWKNISITALFFLIVKISLFDGFFGGTYTCSSMVELWTHDPKIMSLNHVWVACCVLEQDTSPLDPGVQMGSSL